MALGKCPRTGKLFDKKTGPVHPDAMTEEEADYSKILDYVADHPNCGPDEVVEETGVLIECVNRMVQQGRMERLTASEVEAKALDQARRADEVRRMKTRLAQDLADATKRPDSGDERTSVRSLLNEKRRGN